MLEQLRSSINNIFSYVLFVKFIIIIRTVFEHL